jgi:hypothetical protein
MFAVGASAWIYAKLMRRSGNNTKQSIIVTVIAGAVIFLVFFSIASMIL